MALTARRPAPAWTRRGMVVGALAFLALASTALLWAKWLPYRARIGTIGATGRYTSPPTNLQRSVGSIANPADAWHFATTYLAAIWPALVAALVISAALTVLLPGVWVRNGLGRGGALRRTGIATALSLPSMMCTCCAAPVAVTLRRRGAGAAQAAAYWLGNPLLNPAVLVFVALLLPWPFVVVRVVAGVVLVAGVSWLCGRLDGRAPASPATTTPLGTDAPPAGLSEATRRITGTALRLGVLFLPEYVLAVFVAGLFVGAVPHLAHDATAAGVLAILAVVATLFVIPTGGEIPLVMGALAGGLGNQVATVLLIALPALSAPSIIMVRRALPARALAAAAACVAAGSFVAALIVGALG